MVALTVAVLPFEIEKGADTEAPDVQDDVSRVIVDPKLLVILHWSVAAYAALAPASLDGRAPAVTAARASCEIRIVQSP